MTNKVLPKITLKRKIQANVQANVDPDQPNQNELRVLKEHFGFNSFRSGQWRIMKTLLREKRDVCGILATGQGKSLCYQFPAVLSQKTVLVVSPLISLMDDQKMSLQAKKIPCEVLNGNTRNRGEAMDLVIKGVYRVVYTTPEFIVNNFGMLNLMNSNSTLELIAIDEAHCISQWGHDFRPSYRKLTCLREHLPENIPILALTATATPTITKDICANLNLKNVSVIRASTDRPNLSIWVKKKSSGGSLADLKEVLGKPGGINNNNNIITVNHEKPIESKSKVFIVDSDDEEEVAAAQARMNDGEEEEEFEDEKEIGHGDSVIIYTNSRKDCENIYRDLKRAKYSVDYYHAGLSNNQRSKVHQDFIYDRTPIVVATIAFGMGIDKPSIRKIINWGIPANLETYYQEIGRAGRDGLDSDCYLFYSNGDLFIHKFLISKMEASKQVQEHHLHLMELMRQWATSPVCRQYQLAQYFEKESLMMGTPTLPEEVAKFCDRCDNCHIYQDKVKENGGEAHTEEKVNVGPEVKLMVRLVRTLSTNYGFKNLIGILTGTKAKTFPARLKNCALYGDGDNHSQVYWRALGDMLIDHGYLKYTKVGGLYGNVRRGRGKKAAINKVFQVVSVGSKKLELDDQGELWVVPNSDLRKCIKSSKGSTTSNNVTPVGGLLMTKLKEFRAEVSQKMNLPPYLVMGDTVINGLLGLKLPTDISQLAMVNGINTHVLMIHGDQLVELMNYLAPKVVEKKEKKVSKTQLDEGELTDSTASISGADRLNQSQKVSLALFVNQQLDSKGIAKKRGMVASTIESHLMKIYSCCPNLDSSRILDADLLSRINAYLDDHATQKLKEIKDGLKGKGIEASYLQIKVTLALRSNQ